MRLLRIGEVAARSGLTPDAVRYYERVGVLRRASRTAGGYREYPEAVVDRLRVVRNAQQFGFSLAEIAAFLRVRDQGGRPCDQVRAAAARMLEEVDRQIARLLDARSEMERTLHDWDRRLAAAGRTEPARLLEHVAAGSTAASKRQPVGRTVRVGRRQPSAD